MFRLSNTVTAIILVISCSVLVTRTSSEVIQYRTCADYETSNCTVSDVVLNPCPEAAKNLPCIVRKAKQFTLQFQFKGPKDVSGLETRAYWATWPVDLPLIGMDTDGCAHTTCPTLGESENFSYDMTIGKKFPLNSYDVKWRLYKEDQMDCCIIFRIKLVSK